MNAPERPPVYYSEYLQLDKILNAQAPESAKEGREAGDEMLFIIIHQAYELWFKQILHELAIVQGIFRQPELPNNSPDIYNSVHRLKRVASILQLAVMQMSVMESMTPLDFLDFRDLLRPASGFQSIQFKMVEAALGLQFKQRHGQGYYLSQLNPADVDRVKKAESEQSLLELVNLWLERMPYVEQHDMWLEGDGFWKAYRQAYEDSLSANEAANINGYDALFTESAHYPEGRRLSRKATRNALFIMLYRDFPLMHLPFELLTALLDIDEQLGMWRSRHVVMVQRMIGNRTGTGGSTGADYLAKAANSHYVFREFSDLTSYLLPRQQLPKLPEALVRQLSFA